MIISHEHRYIFVGFPQAASSAISRELVEQYEGESILGKHTNIPTLCRVNPDLNIAEYFVFGVYRDPVDIVFTTYNKMRTNAKNTFTTPRFFRENGGHVSRKDRAFFDRIRRDGLSFADFVRHAYRFFPFDSDFSISYPFLDQVIRFSCLAEDFNRCLKQIGLSPVRDLPVFNRTEKVTAPPDLSDALHSRVFGPYLERYTGSGLSAFDREVSVINRMRYAVFSRLRTRVRLRFELKRARSIASG